MRRGLLCALLFLGTLTWGCGTTSPEPENPEDGMVDFSPEPATTSKAERELTEEERYALGEELPDESLLEEFPSEQDENG